MCVQVLSEENNCIKKAIDVCPVCSNHVPEQRLSNCGNGQNNNLLEKMNQISEKLSKFTDDASIVLPVAQRTRGKYVGCFQDQAHHRGLKGYIRRSYSNTIEGCIDICRSGNYVYAGLQAG